MRHWVFIILGLVSSLSFGCSSGGSGSDNGIPKAATAMATKLTSDVDKFMPRVAGFEGALVFILNPGTPLSQGVTLTPDASPGAPPFSFTFDGDYDGNDDGWEETKVSGSATFNSDPDVAWSGVSGHADLDIAIPVIGHVYQASINFTISASDDRQLSGSGTFTNPVTGEQTTMTVDAATPLQVKLATNTGDAVSNSCAYSLDGQMQIERTGSSGTLRSTWNFSSDSASVLVNNRTFTDASGTTALPDITVVRPCASGGSINDWAGTYDHQWACLPRESGSTTLSIAVTGADTITVTDADTDTYTAQMMGNPHSLRGFFLDGPQDFRYREDFNWTMRKNLSGFSQVSRYEYIEGPRTGSGGVCVAHVSRS